MPASPDLGHSVPRIGAVIRPPTGSVPVTRMLARVGIVVVLGAGAPSLAMADEPPTPASDAAAPAATTPSPAAPAALPSRFEAESPDLPKPPMRVSPSASPAVEARPAEAPAVTDAGTEVPRIRSLQAAVAPLYVDLSDAQRRVLAPFEPEWNTWPAAEKTTWINLANRYPRMSEAERDRARVRVQDWARLTPEQRRVVRANYRLARELPRESRVQQWQRYESLTSEQKGQLREAGLAAPAMRETTGLAKEVSKPFGPVIRTLMAPAMVPAANQDQAEIRR